MGKLLLGMAGLSAIAYASFCILLWWGQTRLIFYPQPAPNTTPRDVGLAYEDVWIPVGSDRLHGWWLPGTRPGAKTMLVLHGNASNVESTLRQTWLLIQAGCAALIIDYRGYGFSSGAFPNEAQVYEDAAAAWAYLTQTRQIAPEEIVIFGHSIGGAIAIDLAAQQPRAAGLIVQASFTSMADMMDHTGYSRVAPKWLLRQYFDSKAKISQIAMPLLLIHGTADETVPVQMSQRLYEAAIATSNKSVWIVPEATHNGIADSLGTEYTVKIQQWLQSISQVPQDSC